MMIGILAAAAALAVAGQPQPQAQPQAQAQAQAQAQPRPSPFVIVTETAHPANPADVASLDAIMRAVYDVISGPAGQKRDWNRMRSLFTSNARMMPHGARGLRSGSVEDYISSSGPFLEERGFVEREIARRVEQYGDIAHVFSTYEGRFSVGEAAPVRGINSFQLVRHAGRWWVVSIMWQAETPQTPIPAGYLTSAPAGGRG
jgi:hypothetical protein